WSGTPKVALLYPGRLMVTLPMKGREYLPARQQRAGLDEAHRIDGLAIHPHLVVQMRAGRAAGRADAADHVPLAERVADGDADLGHVAVACRDAVAVVDLD